MTEEPTIPAEIVVEARRLWFDQTFRRQIVKRTPVSFHFDECELTCGHTERAYAVQPEDVTTSCLQCMKQWMAEEVFRRG